MCISGKADKLMHHPYDFESTDEDIQLDTFSLFGYIGSTQAHGSPPISREFHNKEGFLDNHKHTVYVPLMLKRTGENLWQ